MTWGDAASWAGLVLVTGVLPTLAARGLVRATAESDRTVANYRGRRVAPVLGVAWLVWAFGVAAFSLVTMLGTAGAFTLDIVVSSILVLGAFALGLTDDAFGDRVHSGFGGHLGALGKGQLTTGVLKLLGIGAAAAGAGLWVAGTEAGFADLPALALTWLAAVAVIAGSANLVNLADLRPLRALKAYVLLAVIAAALGAASLAGYSDRAPSVGLGTLILLLGPALAVWGPDAQERGMLGDAGSNAAGALVGFWLARALVSVPAALGVAAVIVVALNLVSERVSFSEVIEGNPALKRLDMLGRPKE